MTPPFLLARKAHRDHGDRLGAEQLENDRYGVAAKLSNRHQAPLLGGNDGGRDEKLLGQITEIESARV
jgi:hypothetical protein